MLHSVDRTIRFARYAFGTRLANAAISIIPSLSSGQQPPSAFNFGGPGDYVKTGDSVVQSLVSLGGLASGQRVVEIGSGIGGNATALYRALGSAISYSGFDIVRLGTTWCRKHFARLAVDYTFVHSDVYNSFYNPLGKVDPSEYIFPFESETADLIFANSVFTHMQPRDVSRYIVESSRVLRPGGRTWFTFFVLDDDSEKQIALDASSYSFRFSRGECKVELADQPDVAVAYSLPWIEQTLGSVGLRLQNLQRSSWRGRSAIDFQDIVTAVRA